MKIAHTLLLALSLFVVFAMSLPCFAQDNEQILSNDYAKHFDQYDVKGSMIIYDLKRDRIYYYDKERTK